MAAKEGIWRREFIDILTLLMHGKEGLDTRRMGAKDDDKKVRYQAWPEKTIGNWLEAFSILSAVIMEKYPEQGQALFQYSRTIHNEATRVGGIGWFLYDREFRKKMALCPELGWDQKEVQLWMEYMGKYIPLNKDPFSRFSNRQQGGRNSDPQSRPFWKQPFRAQRWVGAQRGGVRRPGQGTCRLFNAGSCSWGKECKFSHNCAKCNAPHPTVSCKGVVRHPPTPSRKSDE